MQARTRGSTAAWLALLIAVQLLAFLLLWWYAVRTEQGQWLDTVALTGNSIGRDHIAKPVDQILNAMSAVSLVGATAFIGFIALIRRRIALAVVATLLIAGANITTQLLKHTITRPDFGIDPERAVAGNSLPSGHAAIAASVAVALVLVLPRQVRALGAVIGAAYAALAGVATLSAGWHRPSDAMAAFLVVGVWAALAGLVLLFTEPDQQRSIDSADGHRLIAGTLGFGGLALLACCALALVSLGGDGLPEPTDLERRTLFLGYAGSALGIAGTSAIVVSLVLLTVHRLVPRRAAEWTPGWMLRQ